MKPETLAEITAQHEHCPPDACSFRELLAYIRELEAVAEAARAYHDPESCYVCSVPSPIDGRAGRLRCRLAVSLATLDASQRGGEATDDELEFACPICEGGNGTPCNSHFGV